MKSRMKKAISFTALFVISIFAWGGELRLAYTSLPSKAEVYLDEDSIGKIPETLDPEDKFITLQIKGKKHQHNEKQYRLLTLDFEEPGIDDFHIFIYIHLNKDNPDPINISLPEIEALSFSVRKNVFESAPYLFAGDDITLSLNQTSDAFDEIIWMAVPGLEETGEEAQQSNETKRIVEYRDYSVFLDLRNTIRWQMFSQDLEEEELVAKKSKDKKALSDKLKNFIGMESETEGVFGERSVDRLDFSIGKGTIMQWEPPHEGRVRIVVLAKTKGSNSRWLSVSRVFNVVDLRPTIWIRPNGLFSTSDLKQMKVALDEINRLNRFSPLQQSYLIFKAFDRIEYVAYAGEPVTFELLKGPFINAEFPIKSMSLRIGENEVSNFVKNKKTEGQEEGLETSEEDSGVLKGWERSYTHTFTNKPGKVNVTFSVEDVHGLKREQSIDIDVRSKRSAQLNSDVSEQMKEHFGDAFWLFAQAVIDWAESVSKNSIGIRSIDDKPYSVSFGYAPLPKDTDLNNRKQSLPDLLDHFLVKSFRNKGHSVFERDQGWMQAAEKTLPNQNLLKGNIERMPSPQRIVLYKVKKAAVEVESIGPIVMRRAKLLTFVRTLDPITFEILDNQIHESTSSDFQVDFLDQTEQNKTVAPIDVYSPGYLMQVEEHIPDDQK